MCAENFMAEAIAEAKKGWGKTHPNPLVGAVIVEDGEIVARGYHARAGEPHAEIQAFNHLGRKPQEGATLYVTLEPCSTDGKTGACSNAIIESGLRSVVVGAIDPNPLHKGNGLALLKRAGVAVASGVLARECEDLNLIFNHWIVEQRPFVAGKIAMTLDGKIATRSGQSQWITGAEARRDVMRWRRYFPAIAVGSGTVMADNPSLTSRSGEGVWCPRRIIFDRSLRTVTKKELKVYSDEFLENTIVVTTVKAPEERKHWLKEKKIAVWEFSSQSNESFIGSFLTRCQEAFISGIYVEGGGELLSSLINAMFVNYLFIYQAPKIMGDATAHAAFKGRNPKKTDDVIHLQNVIRKSCGTDSLIRGQLR